MKKVNFVLLLSLFCAAAFAQVPGYMGLKFSVKYDAGLMLPAVVGRSGSLPMLYNNLSVDYVITRHLSVGVKYGFMTYNAPAEARQFKSTEYGTPLYNNTDYKGRYTQHTAAFMLKVFGKRRGYIAPFGRYATFGVYYQHVVDREATIFANGRIGSNSVGPTGFKGTANYGGFIIGGGRNYIVGKRLIIDLGCNINVPLGLIDPVVDGEGEKGTIYRDVALRNLLQLYLGFGVLAF